jgi:hypothetical protein
VNLLQSNGVPSLLDIDQGFCTVDAAGAVHAKMYPRHHGEQKMNRRGVVTDGTNNFWGCGNAFGTIYCDASGASLEPVEFKAIPSSRAMRIINNVLYVSLNGPDGIATDLPAGILSFEDGKGNSVAFPQSPESSLRPVVKAGVPFKGTAGFDMDPAGTTAYMADTVAGIQKYVKSNGSWNFAYNFSIPQNIPAAANRGAGCFGLVVDFTGKDPVIYATTTEGYGGCVNSNRVVRIVDTNAMAVVLTIAQAPSANIAYRGIDFTPESQPMSASANR